MQKDVEAITSILERYMSRVNARGLVARAPQERGLSAHSLPREDLARCSPALRGAMGLSVSPRGDTEALDRVKEFFRARSEAASCRVGLRKESDIGAARSEARRLCENAGASGC